MHHEGTSERGNDKMGKKKMWLRNGIVFDPNIPAPSFLDYGLR